MPAEAEEREQKDEQRNRQQPDHFTLVADTLTRLQFQFAILRTKGIGPLGLSVHTTILRRAMSDTLRSQRRVSLPVGAKLVARS